MSTCLWTPRAGLLRLSCTRGRDTDTGSSDMADNKGNAGAAGAGAVYGLGLIGALVHYISTANGFWDGVWASSRLSCGPRSSSMG